MAMSRIPAISPSSTTSLRTRRTAATSPSLLWSRCQTSDAIGLNNLSLHKAHKLNRQATVSRRVLFKFIILVLLASWCPCLFQVNVVEEVPVLDNFCFEWARLAARAVKAPVFSVLWLVKAWEVRLLWCSMLGPSWDRRRSVTLGIII